METSFEMLGHCVNLEFVKKQIPLYQESLEALRKSYKGHLKGSGIDPETSHRRMSASVHLNDRCWHCGKLVVFTLDDEGKLALQGHQVNEPCTLPDLVPVKTTFKCHSGKVAVGNDFRKYFPALKEGKRVSVNYEAGKTHLVEKSANLNYVTGFAYGAVYFVPKDDGIEVVQLQYNEEEEGNRPEEEFRVSLELWWYAIVDAADLPEGATDSYDRDFYTFDLPKGLYEATWHAELKEDVPDPVTVLGRIQFGGP
jgi:hypothetical protein